MESPGPDQERTEKPKLQSLPEERSGAQISLTRKIIIGLFIVGYWVFFYWFRGS
jgi:hypothetical protein